MEMRAYIRVVSIYDVAVTRPHRFLTGTAHELYLDIDGTEYDNDWNGTASMSDVADAIYNAMDALVLEPRKMICQTFMMSIYEKWLNKEVDGGSNRNYLPRFAKWWNKM